MNTNTSSNITLDILSGNAERRVNRAALKLLKDFPKIRHWAPQIIRSGVGKAQFKLSVMGPCEDVRAFESSLRLRAVEICDPAIPMSWREELEESDERNLNRNDVSQERNSAAELSKFTMIAVLIAAIGFSVCVFGPAIIWILVFGLMILLFVGLFAGAAPGFFG